VQPWYLHNPLANALPLHAARNQTSWPPFHILVPEGRIAAPDEMTDAETTAARIHLAAASGPVGSLVGQLAKMSGARAVGIAGGSDSARKSINTQSF
jgi:hypothetical protein